MAKKSASPAPEIKPVNSFGKVLNLLREKWPEYLLEIIVIIFSITISFALDEWKDQRQKKETEQTYLKGLYSDIQTDMNQINEVINETKQVIQATRTLSEMDTQRSAITYAGFVDNVRFMFKRPRFIAEDATFADLKSTGNMQVISSLPFKKALFDYYKQYETIIRVETAELETTNTIVGPSLLGRLPLGKQPSTPAKAAWTSIINDVAFQNSILVRRSTREELLRDYQDAARLGKSLLASIKSQLK
ncbi:hypothetical protein IC229_16140 [Spirosoma sp. BT702]|uniref:Uncharacterized protein n=1 Tax=Spirosoma profusum TaxID=2771354 RepID=A0A926Y222_9BACT|nr:hypothetical protein [Spirosoma profusum]MBD2702183.1 hypothetical protein [Spirosoma profusum]